MVLSDSDREKIIQIIDHGIPRTKLVDWYGIETPMVTGGFIGQLTLVERGDMDNLLYDNKLLCVRCGRTKTYENMKHSRLHGRMCLCGSQEWIIDKSIKSRTLSCGHNQGIVYGETSWTCAVCGEKIR